MRNQTKSFRTEDLPAVLAGAAIRQMNGRLQVKSFIADNGWVRVFTGDGEIIVPAGPPGVEINGWVDMEQITWQASKAVIFTIITERGGE